MGWTRAIKHIRCHIQISNRCGQTSTEVLVAVGRQEEMVASRAARPDTLAHPWLGPHTADWSPAGGKVTTGLTCLLATGCRGQACLLLQVPGHSGDPGPGGRDEARADPG